MSAVVILWLRYQLDFKILLLWHVLIRTSRYLPPKLMNKIEVPTVGWWEYYCWNCSFFWTHHCMFSLVLTTGNWSPFPLQLMCSPWVWMPQCSEWVSAAKLISTLWTNALWPHRFFSARVCVSISDTGAHTPLPQMTHFQGEHKVTVCSLRAPSAAWEELCGAGVGTKATLHGDIYAQLSQTERWVGGKGSERDRRREGEREEEAAVAR